MADARPSTAQHVTRRSVIAGAAGVLAGGGLLLPWRRPGWTSSSVRRKDLTQRRAAVSALATAMATGGLGPGESDRALERVLALRGRLG